MSTLTPNYGLIVPEATDTVEQVRADYATNLNTIDASLGGGASTLAGLSDVNLSSPTNGQLLGYNSVSQKWENVNGGGGSGGHTIIDPIGQNMPSRTGLQFIGASVTDDPVNDKTVVTITGGGGGYNYSTTEQVIGTWVNGKPLYQISYPMTINISGGQTVTVATLVDSEDIVYFDGWIKENNIFYGLNDRTSRITVNASKELQFNSSSSWNGSGYITIRYTKTTD